jgi:type III restriction enzyme
MSNPFFNQPILNSPYDFPHRHWELDGSGQPTQKIEEKRRPAEFILDSDWEAEFCRVAESHPKVLAYVKNHSLGFEVPYQCGSESHQYRPDFIVLVDDGHGPDDPLHLVVEIKGYRGEDAKDKKRTLDTYWVPGVNNLKTYGRWAFAEFAKVFAIESDFGTAVEEAFQNMLQQTSKTAEVAK